MEYISDLSKECAEEYQEYVTMFETDPFAEETKAKGEKFMESISHERSKTWDALIESADMNRNSKKAWSTIYKLYTIWPYNSSSATQSHTQPGCQPTAPEWKKWQET